MLITGGGRGIGAATARLAAQAGYDIALTYKEKNQSAELVAQEVKNHGGRALLLRGDVSDEATVLRWFESVEETFGRLDCLVNNAATLATQSRLEDFTLQRVRRIFDVNVLGVFLCLQAAVKKMSTRNGGLGGSIVNVSSVASSYGSANEYIDYAASKGAVDTMTVGLAREVAGEGIRVNAVRPGMIRTELHALGGEPNRVERIAPRIPMQRGGTPEEVAEMIVWLAGDKASYVTGSLLNCSGGL